MRRNILTLSFTSILVLAGCATSTEPAPVETESASAGQVAGDEEALACRPDCTNQSFYRLNLSNADMSATDFSGSMFDYANLNGANFEGSNLMDAAMTHVDLRNANLRNANLAGVQLGGAQVNGAIIDNTTCPDGVVRSGTCAP